MAKKNVLVFPCGSEIGIEINRALSYSAHFEVYGASSVDSHHGKYVFRNLVENLPMIDDDDFLKKLNGLINKYNIDFIYPAHDSVVTWMAQHKEKILAEVVTSSYETCRICRSKSETYRFFRDIVDVPRVYAGLESIEEFPVFLKPDIGQGSKGTYKANNCEEVSFYLDKDPSLLVLEYLPGKEYTIDCFTDRQRNLLFVGARERMRILNGISVETSPVSSKRFIQMAEKINKNLSFNGVWFFQVKERADGQFVLLEIAPRIAGSMGLYRNQGINFALLGLYNLLGKPVEIIQNKFHSTMDRALINRFDMRIRYDHVYIDLDDTLIVNNQVNIFAVAFIYQCRNKGIQVHLLTKHTGDLSEVLECYRLNSLFDSIIHIAVDDEKYKYIRNKNSIFIDDSYRERSRMIKHLGIPVFHVSEIPNLLDWRT